MKLYTVKAEIVYVIAVEDDYDPLSVAVDCWRDLKYDTDASQIDFNVGKEIKEVKDIPYGWDDMCIPYGDGDGNTRIGEMLKDGQLN